MEDEKIPTVETVETAETAPAAPVTTTAEEAPAAEAAPAKESAPAKEADPAPAANTRPAPIKLDMSNMIDDGNDLISVEIPVNRQNEDIERINRAIMTRSICYAIVAGNEVDNGRLIVVLKWENLRVIIPADDFCAYSEMVDPEKATEAELTARYRQRTSRMQYAKVSFIPEALGYNEDGIPFVVGSRKAAMEMLQNKHFFGRNADAQVGSVVKASVITSGPSFVTVEALGVETRIGVSQLSAYEYLDDASKKYPVGSGMAAVIMQLEVDKQNRKVKMALSHSAVERATTPGERVTPRMMFSHYAGIITGENEKYYFGVLEFFKMNFLIPKQYVVGSDVIFERGTKVSFLCTGINEARNLMIGRAVKKNS